ncbi:MAG: helix-turn-helix domain-containing protein [Nitrospinales bacterium]
MKTTGKAGNVFRDLGFDKEEAGNLLIRSKLMIEVMKYIQREKITQQTAAKRFAVKQPRISDLKRGKIELFSVDTLIAMLARVGVEVAVRVVKRKAA